MIESKITINLNTSCNQSQEKAESFKLKHKLKRLLELVPKGSRVQLNINENEDSYIGLMKINCQQLNFSSEQSQANTIPLLYEDLEEVIKDKVLTWKSKRNFAIV